MKTRYFIELSYLGKNYHGWQLQKNAVTIQGTLDKVLSLLLNSEMETIGAGRTDTGVHAKYFVAHFDSEVEFDLLQLCFKLNSFLPKDISVKTIFPVPSEAHSRFDAISRTYQYFLCTEKNPFMLDFAAYFFHPLDIGLMNSAAMILFEYSDFTSFSKLHSDTKTNNCKIMKAVWEEQEKGVFVFTIQADRFLRNMVRAIVGTLLDVGHKKISLNDFRKIIEDKNRCNAGQSVPPQGLFLTDIEYPDGMYGM
ncbi:MAG TPA: tRNA pseudouridine(38-40) synthase TruA [Bacteroidales bacterium]|nr:tRNA pseudouridine(38-40) synthase TruA [Bacteroidales bacterium]